MVLMGMSFHFIIQNTLAMQVLELFKAADKYDVAGLVKECVQIFKKITHAADVAPLLQVSWLLYLPMQVLYRMKDSAYVLGPSW